MKQFFLINNVGTPFPENAVKEPEKNKSNCKKQNGNSKNLAQQLRKINQAPIYIACISPFFNNEFILESSQFIHLFRGRSNANHGANCHQQEE